MSEKSASSNLDRIAERFNVLSHPTRLKLLLIVAAMRDITVSELAANLGLTIPRVSELITQLAHGGFVVKTRLANYVSISLDREGIEETNEFLNLLLNLTKE